MDTFNQFCDIAKIAEQQKIDAALLFIWFHQYKNQQPDVTINQINQYFIDAHLSKYNTSYLKRDLRSSKSVTKGAKESSYKLSRATLDLFNKTYLPHFDVEIKITERANINLTPYLSTEEIGNARKMAELYIILHCLENSVRNFIEVTLTKAIGADWWDKSKNTELEQKAKDRKAKESKNKWLTPRGNSSNLYYIDWGDLVKIIRKNEKVFDQYFGIKFVELRLEELEKIRNIIAHNGMIPSQDDFDRVVLHFKDWTKQVPNQSIT